MQNARFADKKFLEGNPWTDGERKRKRRNEKKDEKISRTEEKEDLPKNDLQSKEIEGLEETKKAFTFGKEEGIKL